MQSRISPSMPLFQLFKAAAAAYMAVHCHGRQQVRLHDGCITTSSENDDIEEVEGLSEVKVVADAETSRKINVFLCQSSTILDLSLVLVLLLHFVTPGSFHPVR